MSSAHDSVTSAIGAAIRQVLHDTGREPRAVEPELLLSTDLGLDSLDLAQTIVLLERSLGVDPFRAPPPGAARPAIRTVADLAGVYREALAGQR
ncbi:MAG: acyl carrier protein [Planctomycetia bacterium]